MPVRYPGRKPLPDRQVWCGILYVLHTDIQWAYLPKERQRCVSERCAPEGRSARAVPGQPLCHRAPAAGR